MIVMNRNPCVLVAGLFTLLAVPAGAQSFNCHKAFFADERTICEERRLGRLDSQLAALFGHVISELPPPRRAALKRQETAWVVARRHCGHDGRCIAGFYGDRIQKLQAILAATEHLAARPTAPMPPQAKGEPPAVASTGVPRASSNGPSDTASGSATPEIPPTNFDIEPEVSPVGHDSSGGSAGGPMTPAR